MGPVVTKQASLGHLESTVQRLGGARAPARVLAARSLRVCACAPTDHGAARAHADREAPTVASRSPGSDSPSAALTAAPRLDDRAFVGGFRLFGFCGITDVAGYVEFLHQPQKPSHRSGRFDTDHDRRRQPRVEVASALREATCARRFHQFRDSASRSFVALRANRSQ